ncbi:MAG TPA: hypothetical protein VJZ50_11010 [Candidatus Limnocylindrales bacterium]|nr:hypothetical protein [Candidatus Limnocylindrales bacterium]
MIRRLPGAMLALAFVWSVPAAYAKPSVNDLLEEARIVSGEDRFQAQALFGDAADPVVLLPSGERGPNAVGWTLGWDSGLSDEPRGLTLQVIDGCPVNDRFWVFAAGSSDVPVQLMVTDTRSGSSTEYSFPGPLPGGSIGPILDPDAFATCALGRDTWLPPPELPALGGEGTFTPLVRRCPRFTAPMSMAQSRPGRSYDRLVIRGDQVNPIVSEDPVIAADGGRSYDERFVLLGGEIPGVIEGLVLSDAQGRLPTPRQFVRRAEHVGAAILASALESARRGQLAQDILREQLGAGRRACLYHLGLELDGRGYDPGQGVDLLEQTGWVLGPPDPSASDRFVVEVTPGDGPSVALPGLPPLPASGPFGPGLLFRDGQASVEILDACGFSERYWVVAAVTTDIPFTLTVSDAGSGVERTYLVGTQRPLAGPIIDTDAFATCP